MNISSGQQKGLLDLPNEILLIIMKYLSTIELFSLFVGINERLDQLVLDPTSMRTLILTCLRTELLPERIFSIEKCALATLCRNVLPRIGHRITQVVVDQMSIEAVFRATEYSQLRSLSLIDIDDSYAFDLLQSDAALCSALNEQISSLVIYMKDNFTDERSTEYYSTIFNSLLKSCRRLTKLHFCPNHYLSRSRPVEFSVMNCQSAILTNLAVRTTSFRECLYLFDGHFPALVTVAISVKVIGHTEWTGEQAQPLHNLKRFSLMSLPRTVHFDNLIVPLLRRMLNLEELSLGLSVIRVDSDYINGAQLRENILQYMVRLNKFIFNIETAIIKYSSEPVFSSNDDIQRTFMEGPFGAVGSVVDVFGRESGTRVHTDSPSHLFYSRCHIYSLPYPFDYFLYLSNSFQGGSFGRVRTLCVADVHRFEHNFFRIISQSFPLLECLHIHNDKPQENKQTTRAMITFPRLLCLDIHRSHEDYATQFLIDDHCQLPRLWKLGIQWASLVSVTHDFTNDATRFFCSQLKDLYVREVFVRPKHFHDYFPSLLQ